MDKETRKLISEDCCRYCRDFPQFSKVRKIKYVISHFIFNPTFRLILWYRLGHDYLQQGRSKFLKKIFEWGHRKNTYKTGIQFGLQSRFGGGLTFSHFSGIVLTGYSKYGSNLTVFQNVTVGVVQNGGG